MTVGDDTRTDIGGLRADLSAVGSPPALLAGPAAGSTGLILFPRTDSLPAAWVGPVPATGLEPERRRGAAGGGPALLFAARAWRGLVRPTRLVRAPSGHRSRRPGRRPRLVAALRADAIRARRPPGPFPGFTFGRGEAYGLHVAWSGNTVHRVERVPSGLGMTGTGERMLPGATTIGGGELLLPGEIVLAEGESYSTPWVYLAAARSGLDDLSAQFHGYLRPLPAHPRLPRPVNLNVWEAVYFRHDLGKLTALAETAAGLGVERFVLDRAAGAAGVPGRARIGVVLTSDRQVHADVAARRHGLVRSFRH